MVSSRKLQFTDSLWPSIRDCLIKSVSPNDHLTVGFSGGVDSMALLDCLHTHKDDGYYASVSAFHVNHGLNPNSAEWALQCEVFCKERGLPFHACQVKVPVDGGLGIEAAARLVRYAALDKADGDWIVLGHHLDDQAETMMLNLLRGSGVKGLAGMKEVQGRYLRPMLELRRKAIELYAHGKGLHWIEDGSNSDERMRRNFVRRSVMPLLIGRYPNAAGNLARTSALMRDADELLGQLAKRDHDFDTPLTVATLRSLSEARGRNLLAYLLRSKGISIPGRARLCEIHRQILSAKSDRHPCFLIGGWMLTRYRDEILLVRHVQDGKSCLLWEGESELDWRHGRIRLVPTLGVGISRIRLAQGPVTFRPRTGGEKIMLHPGSTTRHLKDLLREAGIPAWMRPSIPLMYCNEILVWVGGIGMSAEWVAESSEPGIAIEFEQATW